MPKGHACQRVMEWWCLLLLLLFVLQPLPPFCSATITNATTTSGGGGGITATTTTIAPRFSWDTIQPFIHLANSSGPFSAEAIAIMAKFPMVTVEKFQGPCAAKSRPPTDTCHQEALIIDALRRVKGVNPRVCTIFYYNSILNFPQYDLSARFMADNATLLLHDVNGSLITESGGGKSGLTVFDYQQRAAADLWASACINATLTGHVDGCFADRAVDVQKFETNGQLTPPQRAAFDRGHWDTLARLQTRIGAGPLIANHAYNLSGVGGAMIEFGRANMETLQDIQMSVANGKVTQVHFSSINDDTVATFLIGAGENTFIGAGGWSISGSDVEKTIGNRWLPQYYERPLGAPLDDASVMIVATDDKGKEEGRESFGTTTAAAENYDEAVVTGGGGGGVVAAGTMTRYTRRFSRGTNVTLSCSSSSRASSTLALGAGGSGSSGGSACTGKIEWGH